MLKEFLVSALLLSWTAAPGFSQGQSAGVGASGAKSASDPSASADPPKPPIEIHVDQQCRILPDPNQPVAPGAKPPHPHHDAIVCHLEGVLHSDHMEETTVSGKQHKFLVSVAEQEYVLQNVNSEPAIFIVEQLVRPDWAIDSDPPPIQMVPAPTGTSGQIALFRANAVPHQIVRLHVGMRHNWVKKPKPASNQTPAQTAASPAGSPPKTN
jgi:hypothetical protein